MVPGVGSVHQDGGLLFLNPAAFATPAPGTFGNLEREFAPRTELPAGRLRCFSKHFSAGGRSDFEFRVEVFNLFNVGELHATRSARCRRRCRPTALTEANSVQPGQPYTTGRGRHVRLA